MSGLVLPCPRTHLKPRLLEGYQPPGILLLCFVDLSIGALSDLLQLEILVHGAQRFLYLAASHLTHALLPVIAD